MLRANAHQQILYDNGIKMAFDPFGDFETHGYLRNNEGLKDREIIKRQEHLYFVANVETALEYLSPEKSREINYESFLEVHRILFDQFYPWAGQDRYALGVGKHVGKGDGAVEFEQSDLSRRAVEWGLSLSTDPTVMRKKPGTIMGLFAWGHPFLDGNGRTMLLVHTELCSRAGFAIDWTLSSKSGYLDALTKELWNPDKGILDQYFEPFIYPVDGRQQWRERILAVRGLDGIDTPELNVVYQNNDPHGNVRYNEMVKTRARK
jgi:cell filamentation protein